MKKIAKMPRTKKALKITGIVFLVFAGVFAALNFIPGFSVMVVRSQSMLPTFDMGDIIVTGPVTGFAGKVVEPGAVITFEKGSALVTHRIVEIKKDDTLVTKGDSMETNDPNTVRMSDVRGVYLFKIPYIGYLTQMIRTRIGWFIAILVPAFVLIGLFIKDILKEAFRTEKKTVR